MIEYLRAFLFGRVAWDAIGALVIVSGAFGLFRRDVLDEVGGYWTDTVGEDLELTVRLHKHMRDAAPALSDHLLRRPGVLDRGPVRHGLARPPAPPLAPRPMGVPVAAQIDDPAAAATARPA